MALHYTIYYMRILSASAVLGVLCPVRNTSHTADFIIHVRGDATLTIGPYGSAGTCIINYYIRRCYYIRHCVIVRHKIKHTSQSALHHNR